VSLLVGINDNGDAIAAGSSIDPNTGRYPYGFYSASTGSFSQIASSATGYGNGCVTRKLPVV